MSIKKFNEDLSINEDKYSRPLKDDEEVSVGQIYSYNNGEEIFRITGNDEDKEYLCWHYEILTNLDPEEWETATRWITDKSKPEGGYEELNSKSNSSLKEGNYYKLIDPKIFEDTRGDYFKLKSGIPLIEIAGYGATDDTTSNETGLIVGGNKELIKGLAEDLVAKRNRVEAIEMYVKNEMVRQKAKMMALKRQLDAKLVVFKRQIRRIYRVIQTIELYLGIDEDLVQIQEGDRASEDEPITFRQLILYMDEEVGTYENRGLDYSNLPEFEDWLTTDENYKTVAPEDKCVVVFKPRRYDKYYSGSREDAVKNQWNRHTYFLIRNGDNLYRIDSENIAVSRRLFPKRKELEELFKELDKIQGSGYSEERAKDAADDLFTQYRNLAFLMQGLIDRTDVFKPCKERISIFNMEKNQDAVKFIYDDDELLPDGRMRFWEWVKTESDKIGVGSRILHTGVYNESRGYVSNKDFKDRFLKYYNDYNVPSLPGEGVYEVVKNQKNQFSIIPHYYVDELKEKGLLVEIHELRHTLTPEYGLSSSYSSYGNGVGVKRNIIKDDNGREYLEAYGCTFKQNLLTIKYNPGGTTYSGWGDWEGQERKNNISFIIDPSDDFIINYDQISLEDIDFYLKCRADRHNYYRMMPLLIKLKERLLEERKQEEDFKVFLYGRALATYPNAVEGNTKDFIEELISWWKFKNKYKRAITKDDAKAMRMIEIRLLAKKNLKKLGI